MSWVTVIWSFRAGACLTLAFLQFIVWCKVLSFVTAVSLYRSPNDPFAGRSDRAARANLVFALPIKEGVPQ